MGGGVVGGIPARVPQSCLDGGGYPRQVWMVGGYPSQVCMVGGTWGTPPGQGWMVGGTPGQIWMVGLPGVPPSQVWMGYPPTMTGWGTPPTITGWGTPPHHHHHQHSEHLLRGGRYASCFNAGGLPCFETSFGGCLVF